VHRRLYLMYLHSCASVSTIPTCLMVCMDVGMCGWVWMDVDVGILYVYEEECVRFSHPRVLTYESPNTQHPAHNSTHKKHLTHNA